MLQHNTTVTKQVKICNEDANDDALVGEQSYISPNDEIQQQQQQYLSFHFFSQIQRK